MHISTQYMYVSRVMVAINTEQFPKQHQRVGVSNDGRLCSL